MPRGRIRSRLSYANVTATIALFLALAGGAYAATQLPKNSVGTKQIKKAAVTPEKLSDAAKAALEGPRGLPGEHGAPGERGLLGEPGMAGLTNVVTRVGPEVTIDFGKIESSFATCESGEVLVGGWYTLPGTPAPPNTYSIINDRAAPEDGNGAAELGDGEAPKGWLATLSSADNGHQINLKASALCAVVAPR